MRNTDYRYFLYARKSSESEDRQMASIMDQIAEVKKLAEKYNIEIVDIISESKSAKEPGRVGFNTMLKRIHKGEAQGILTWKLNRLARNPIDGGQISWMLQQNIIKHIRTFEREYYPTDNVLLMQVEFGMANQYVKDLSLDVKRGMRQKAERGWYPISQLPVGYVTNPKFILGTDAEIIPDENQFNILKKLWNILLTGHYTIPEIKKKGDAMALRNKSKKPYSRSTYHFIFTNEFYCGYFQWRDKDGNIIRYKGKHKAMISSAEFQKVQVILHRKQFNSRFKKYEFPYRGMIKCGECGSTITPDHKLQVICTNCKRKYSIKTKSACPNCNTEYSEMKNPTFIDILYYHCTKNKGRCSQGSITRNQIDLFVENELKKITLTKEQFAWGIKKLKDCQKESLKKEESIISDLRKRKTELENRISGFINLRADGEISAEQFNTSLSVVQKEIWAIDIEIEKLENINNEWYEAKKNDYNFVLEVLKRFKKGDDLQKTEILRSLASNLILMDKKLEITTKNSFMSLKKENCTDLQKFGVSNLNLPCEI